MDMTQIAEELRHLSDRADRIELGVGENVAQLQFLADRHIPASVADVRHTLAGMHEIIANIAGTQAKLAFQLSDICDRITLLERAVG